MPNVLSADSRPQLQLYDQLLQFPLFLGMSRPDLLDILGTARFDFRKYDAGRTVALEGERNSHLFLLIRGEASVWSVADDHSYQVLECLSAPWAFEPESLFGLSTRFSKTVIAAKECHFVLLSKDEILRLLDTFLAFRINYLNLLSTAAQQRARRFWRKPPHSLEERISHFFIDHSAYPAGYKEFRLLMARLALILNDSRIDVSRALNSMQQKGLLELHRGRIVIPSLERLFM
jgi:CRP-like cAMP-binding protein